MALDVLTDLASVWEVHEEHHADKAHEDGHDDVDEKREITLALVRYRSPLAAVMLPRWVNAQDGLQSAAPALETARLIWRKIACCSTRTGSPLTTSVPLPKAPVAYGICSRPTPQSQRWLRLTEPTTPPKSSKLPLTWN